MKRSILALSLALLFAFASCGTAEKVPDAAQSTPEQQTVSPTNQDNAAETLPDKQQAPDDGKNTEEETGSEDTASPAKTEQKPKADTETGKKDDSPTQPEPAAPKAPKKQDAAAATPAESTAESAPALKEEPKKQTVTISIRGSEAVGIILPATEVEWQEGDTAFSVLKKVTREGGIQMEFNGSGTNVYVEGIANLYEFDEGATSGWVYRVNGAVIGKSAGACALSPGDRVEWLYTLNLGKDLN